MRLSSTLSNNQRKNFVKKFFFLIRYQIIKTNNNNNYCRQEHGIIDTDIESADWRKIGISFPQNNLSICFISH